MEQAQNTARFLNGHKIAHIYSSPIERAHETARIAAEHNNVSLTVDERLTELDMGSFTGSKYDEIMEKHGNVFLKFYQNDPEIPKYGVETFDNLKKRVLDMVEYVRDKHPGDHPLDAVTFPYSKLRKNSIGSNSNVDSVYNGSSICPVVVIIAPEWVVNVCAVF